MEKDFGKILKRIDLHPEADLEGGDALAFYRERASAEVAFDFDEKVHLAFTEIGQHPDRYPHWRFTQVRKYALKRYPYQIFYIENPEHIRVLAIAHTSRRPGYWKTRIAD